MTAVGARTAVIPLRLGGMWSAGDPSSADSPTAQPENTVRELRNYLVRPNRWDGRPPFVYDSLMSVMGLARWEDLTNQRTSTMAFDATKIYKKPTTGLAWDGGTSATFGTRLTDFANIYGKMYAMFDDGAGAPTAAFSYDGTNVSATPFNTSIFSRTVTTFIERLFLAYPRVTVAPRIPSGSNLASTVYEIGTGTNTPWALVNCTAQSIVSGSNTIGRVYLTSTTNSYIWSHWKLITAELGLASYLTGATQRNAIFRADFQSNSATYNLPVTVQVILETSWAANTVYAAGDIVTNVNQGSVPPVAPTHRFRCRIGGTSGGAAPAWVATISSDTVDNTVTWICEEVAALGESPTYIINSTQAPDWQTVYVPATVPLATNTQMIGARVNFFNSTTPTIQLVSVNLSLKDAVADGDPSKANRGWQFTVGDFYFPFLNTETATSAAVNLDAVIWSDIGNVKSIRAQSTFPLSEVAGLPTAATVIGGGPQGRYWTAKRRGYWVFKRTTDKNSPILPESSSTEIGCLGPRAWDKWGNELFWIGENGIYRMSNDGGAPIEIGGDGMREEIMSRGSNWVESQATYNIPFLVIDHANKEVWVYTQKSKIYVYHIPSNCWSVIDCPNSTEVRSMLFDTIGQRMLVSYGGAGVTRLMETTSAGDTIESTVTPYVITYDVVFKPIELFGPRYEAALLEVGVFHNATASQVGESISIAYSLNRGTTWTTPGGYPVRFDPTYPRIPMPVETAGPSLMLRLRHQGTSGGPAKWSLSKVDAKLQIKRGELPWANAV